MITREKKTYSGRLLEVDYYMINKAGRKMPSRTPRAKSKAEIAAQQEYEKRRRIKKAIRLVNANFSEEDFFITPTYSQNNAPLTFERAEKDIQNYLRRVQRHRAKELKKVESELKSIPRNSAELKDLRNSLLRKRRVLRKPLKYWLSFEKVYYKTGKNKGKPNFHAHMFISGGLSPKQMESLWGKGMQFNAQAYKPEMWGPQGAARYMSKSPEGSRTVRHSRNLAKPKEKIKDGAFTKGNLQKLCRERVDDSDYWQKKFKGYKLLQTEPRYNQYNGLWYMTVTLWRTDSVPPPWRNNEWKEGDK